MRAERFHQRAAITVPAVVAGVSNGTGLTVVRELGRLGVPVLAVDSSADALGFVSRYARPALCRDPFHDEHGFMEDLMAVLEPLPQAPVVFPAQDDYCTVLSRHVERLEPLARPALCRWDAMQTLADKGEQVRVAQGAGVPTPATAFIGTPGELGDAGARIGFPAVLKATAPLAMKRVVRRKVVVVPDAAALEGAYRQVETCGPVMLQEVVPGGDEQIMIAAAYHDAQGRPLGLFVGRKIRQHPRAFGNTRLAVSEWSDEVAELTLRVLDAFHYQGVSDVEFKRDPRDGTLKFMEVNARHGLFAGLATAAGVDLTAVAYLDMIGRPVKAGPQRDGVVWADMLRDAKDSLGEARRGQLSLREWLAPLPRLRAEAVLSLADPGPSLREIARIARRAVGRDGAGLYD